MILETPWAMPAPALARMLQTAARAFGGKVTIEVPDTSGPEAVATRSGEQLEGARAVQLRDGVAVVPVVGPVVRRSSIVSRLLGAASVERLARDIHRAVEAPEVRGILLDVDSPGGTVNGVSELSDLLFGLRGEIPVRAHVGGAGTSGAYWLATAAGRLEAADTALLGSIGVRMALRQRNRPGVRTIEFVSSQSPRKAADPTSEEGREDLQRIVDDLADVFVDDIARNRGVDRTTVLEDFGGGAVLVGEEALERGMVDGIATLESTLGRFQDEIDRGVTAGQTAASSTSEEPSSPDPIERIRPAASAEPTETEPDQEEQAENLVVRLEGLRRRMGGGGHP